MIQPNDPKLIIQGSLENYFLADAFAATHRRSAMLILVPSPKMVYPDGRNVGRLNIYFDDGCVTTVQRNRYFAPNKVAALDLCAPYAPFNPATFELTLVDREPDPENFAPLDAQLFTIELAGYSDEVMGFQPETVVRFYQLCEHAFGSDRNRATEELEDQILGMIGECLQPGTDFTVAEISEALGISPTGCTVLLKKLQNQGLVRTAETDASAYSGTLGRGTRRFVRHRLPGTSRRG